MTVHGAGSLSSPIVISDDEEEAIVESQLRVLSSSSSPSGADDFKETSPSTFEGFSASDLHVNPSIAKSVGYSMALRMGFRPGHGLGFELDGRVEPVSMAFKRKRTDSGIGFQSSSDDSESPFQNGPTGDERKKPKPNYPPRASEASPPVQSQTAQLQKPTAFKGKDKSAVVHPPPPQKLPPAPLSSSLAVPSDSGPSKTAARITHAHEGALPPMPQPPHLDPFGVFPACSAPGLQEMWPPPWLAFSTPPYGLWQGPMPSFSEIASAVANTAVHSPSNSGSVQQEVTRETHGPPPSQHPGPPKSTVSIGRGPEADLQGTHGTYSKPVAPPPNPSCTLVLDVIPPRFRSAAWLETWAANASQLPALRVDIDSKKGKGLVEFPDMVTAQKAFNSKQLRGKGRHSIKAWWYRPSGVASTTAHLNNSAGELEEGEIVEIPASEVSRSSAHSKPLTRKQKKKQKTLPTQQLSSVGGVDGPVSKECEPPPTVQPANPIPSTRVEPINLPHTVAESSVISLPPPSTITCVSPSSVAQSDATDTVMTSPRSPTSDLPSMIPPPVEKHTSLISTESQQTEIVMPLSTVDVVLAESSVTIKDNSALSPVPPQVPDSQTHIKSPSRIPSEPRGFRSPPVGPSFTKRSLLARQKELEDKINQSKLALEKMHKTPSTTPIPPSLESSSPTPIPPPVLEDVSDDRLSMEQNLRRLVLESKKGKAKPAIASTNIPPPTPPTSNGNIPILPSSTVSTSLDQMAISFITESIEIAKQPMIKTAPPNAREELALKQQRLERFITESKTLMDKLGKTSNKEEREKLLSAMREYSRMIELDSSCARDDATMEITRPVVEARPFRWPSSCEDSLEISDEEE